MVAIMLACISLAHSESVSLCVSALRSLTATYGTYTITAVTRTWSGSGGGAGSMNYLSYLRADIVGAPVINHTY